MDSKTLERMVTEWKFDLALNSHGGVGVDPEIPKRMAGEGYTFNRASYKRTRSSMSFWTWRWLKEKQPSEKIEGTLHSHAYAFPSRNNCGCLRSSSQRI